VGDRVRNIASISLLHNIGLGVRHMGSVGEVIGIDLEKGTWGTMGYTGGVEVNFIIAFGFNPIFPYSNWQEFLEILPKEKFLF